MTTRKFFSPSIAVVSLLFASACGGDSKGTTGPGDGALTQAQFASMSSTLTAVVIGAYDYGILNASQVPAPAQVALRAVAAPHGAWKEGFACPLGGRVEIAGGYTIDSVFYYDYALTDTLSDCAARGDDGTEWQFNSLPVINTRILVHAEFADSITESRSDSGTIRYSSGSLTGSCYVNLATVAHGGTSSTSVFIRAIGTVCGRAVNDDTSISFDRAGSRRPKL